MHWDTYEKPFSCKKANMALQRQRYSSKAFRERKINLISFPLCIVTKAARLSQRQWDFRSCPEATPAASIIGTRHKSISWAISTQLNGSCFMDGRGRSQKLWVIWVFFVFFTQHRMSGTWCPICNHTQRWCKYSRIVMGCFIIKVFNCGKDNVHRTWNNDHMPIYIVLFFKWNLTS